MNPELFYSNTPLTTACCRLGILLCCLSTFLIAGCRKNLKGPDAGSMNEFSVSLPQEAITLIRGIEGGDSLKAQISFPGQPEKQSDNSAFTYIWTSLINRDTLSTRHFLTFKDFDGQPPALISCLLTVQEKSTGITKHATSSVFVTTATREGWALLGERSGKASLSMLTYTPQGYRKFIDLESELGLHLPLQGKPVSIDALGTDKAIGNAINQWLGVSTDQQIKIIQTMDFIEKTNVSDYLTNTLQPAPAHPVTLAVNGYNSFVASQGNDVYFFNTRLMVINGRLTRTQINTYPPGETGAAAFKASGIHAFMDPLPRKDYSCIVYDAENYQFVSARLSGNADINGVFPLQLPFSLQGFQLKSMSTRMKEEKAELTAFLYNPSNSKGYVIQFLSNGILKLIKEIPALDAIDLVQSKFIEIDNNTGYLLYTKGSEVKAYDYQLGQTFSLLNFGSEEITLIKITKHIPPVCRMPGRLELYQELLKRLVVCTYNPAMPDNGGIFMLFQIPLGHQSPVKETEEKGFPKIVDVAFVPIP